MLNTVSTLMAREEQAQRQVTQTPQALWCSWLSSSLRFIEGMCETDPEVALNRKAGATAEGRHLPLDVLVLPTDLIFKTND